MVSQETDLQAGGDRQHGDVFGGSGQAQDLQEQQAALRLGTRDRRQSHHSRSSHNLPTAEGPLVLEVDAA